MTEVKSIGISKTMFVVGIIAAILASSLISAVIVTQLPTTNGLKGDKGDKGDSGATGATGPQGLQGVQGPTGVTGATGPEGPKGDKGDPGDETVFARWEVTWYTLTGDYQLGASVGTSSFSPTFFYNWGSGVVFLGYDDWVAFHATMTINKSSSGPVTFTIGADDECSFYIDYVLYISLWQRQAYRTKSITIDVAPGLHVLTLAWSESYGLAAVSFDCDPDVLMWNP